MPGNKKTTQLDLTNRRPTQQLTEIRHLQKVVTEDTLNSTLEMLKLFEESKDAGVRTLELLVHQGDQLNNVGGDLTTLGESVSESRKDLRQIELVEKGCCCLVFCKCGQSNPRAKVPESDSSSLAPIPSDDDEYDDGKSADSESRIVIDKRRQSFIPKTTNNDMEKEIDGNLVRLFDGLLGLKQHALQMGGVIGTQNEQLDHLNKVAAKNQAQLSSATKKVGKLLK